MGKPSGSMAMELESVHKQHLQRSRAIRELDVKWARKQNPRVVSEQAVLMALHKARYDCEDIEPELRAESAKWLKANGWEVLYGPLR